jgi:hypothetical protein
MWIAWGFIQFKGRTLFCDGLSCVGRESICCHFVVVLGLASSVRHLSFVRRAPPRRVSPFDFFGGKGLPPSTWSVRGKGGIELEVDYPSKI